MPMENVFTNLREYKSTYKCEYLIIGTGPGGSVAGEMLARAGKDVVFLEGGGYYPRGSYTEDISEMTCRLYRDCGVSPFIGVPSIAFVEANCVGGGSVINGGLLWRTPSWILEEWKEKYGLLGYDEKALAVHFESIEDVLSVTRQRLDTDSNLDSVALAKGANKLNWKYVMVPRAVKNCRNKNFCPTGCISGAKQSMLETYLPTAVRNGSRIFANLRAKRIDHSNGKATKVVTETTGTHNKKQVEFQFDKVVLACGAIQTPHLLRRSRLAKSAGSKLEFHMNLKIVARFKDPVFAENGTMFTVQVQEFEKEGTLFMASNMRPHYMAMTLSHYGNRVINEVLGDYDCYALYAAMIRPQSKAHIVSHLGDSSFVWYKLDQTDIPLIKKSLRQAVELLFASGAVELYLPITGINPIKSLEGFDRVVDGVGVKNFEIVSVHAMGSCPMGVSPRASVVDQNGKVWGLGNLYITDASVLPSNIGESPQGTIMAFASEIMNRHLH
jgi:choline dehydrogenase-like flavoprotein